MIITYSTRTLIIICVVLVQQLFVGIANPSAEDLSWDDQWSYVEEISIPFDTSTDAAGFQPIDISVEFENPCWAQDEECHSIRIICQDEGEYVELESQIYDLEYADDQHLSSCNLVFLLPADMTGSERFYMYYDDTEKQPPEYQDHVSIGESYYFYEPIPGYPLESSFYKIIDDGFIIYSVSQEGQFMGYNTGQHVYKMTQGTTEVLPKNGELFAAFDFKYCYDHGVFDYSSTSQKLLSKQVMTDGNLMVQFSLTSTSKLDDVKTTAVYKYYHCPSENSRIHVHVKHESLQDINIFQDAKTDGTYASLQIGGVKSNSIEDLNIGHILPYMHFVDEENTLEQQPIDIDPDYIPDTLETRIFGITDDVDLGHDGWVSFDEGDSGAAHAVIFSSDSFDLEGTDEQKGIQLSAFEMDYPHLPGLENNIATIQLCRNSFETDGVQDFTIPSDFVAEFDAEFFSSWTDGYKIIEKESEIFQQLALMKPRISEEGSNGSVQQKKYTVDVSVHFASSFPMGSGLSALTGKNIPYVTVELFKDTEFRYSANAVRLPMNPLDDTGDASLFDTIQGILTVFEWRNSSFFKTARFDDVEKGSYVAKVFLENPIIGKEREFIGYSLLTVDGDSKTHIYCHDEGRLLVTVSDQYQRSVQGALVLLKMDTAVIADGVTNEEGVIELKAPCQADSYTLGVLYNDVVVYEAPVRFTLFSDIISLKQSVSIGRYRLNLALFDSWGLQPLEGIQPVLLNVKANDSIIYPDTIDSAGFVFTNLTPGDYRIHIKYKSYSVDELVSIAQDTEMDLEFPAEFTVRFSIIDSRGLESSADTMEIQRGIKTTTISDKGSLVSIMLPPGTYTLVLYENDEITASRPMTIIGDSDIEIMTNEGPLYPLVLIIAAIVVIILLVAFFIIKKDRRYILYLLPIPLILVSLAFPWWSITGASERYEVLTNMYLYPSNIITLISGQGIISGETAYLPDLFGQAIGFIPVLSILGFLIILFSLYMGKKRKTKLSTVSLILSLFLFIASVTVFLVAMNMVCEIGVGSLIGTDILEVSIPGSSIAENVESSWGLAVGFYSYILLIMNSVVLIVDQSLLRRWKYGKR